MQAYTTKSGHTQFKPSIAQLQEVVEGDNNTGFCLACGHEQDSVEPDARRYQCESCRRAKVYGAEELLTRGLYHANGGEAKPKGILRQAVEAKAAAVRHDAKPLSRLRHHVTGAIERGEGQAIVAVEPERKVLSLREAIVKRGLDPDKLPKPRNTLQWLHADRIIPGVADTTKTLERPNNNQRNEYRHEQAAKDRAFLAKGNGGTAQYVQLFCSLNGLIH